MALLKPLNSKYGKVADGSCNGTYICINASPFTSKKVHDMSITFTMLQNLISVVVKNEKLSTHLNHPLKM